MNKEYSLKDIVRNIVNDKFVLPAWQREYVWDKQKIIVLFDSITRNFPINNIILWKTNKINDDIFYTFINECVYSGNKPTAENVSCKNKISNVYAVLDGQQRLTSIYLVLYNKSKMYTMNKGSLIECGLFISFDDKEYKYSIKERQNITYISNNEKKHWFDVKRLFNDSKYFNRQLLSYKLKRNEINRLKKRYNSFIKILNNKKINCESLNNVDCKIALEIFDRINTQGQTLSMAQMTFSLFVLNNPSLRNTLHKSLNEINGKDEFKFDIDFLVKVMMLLEHENSKYKYKDLINDFNKGARFEKWWDKIIKNLKKVCKMLGKYEIKDKCISSYNAIVPIVYYYIERNGKVSIKEEKAILQYLRISFFKNLFKGSTDAVINKIYGKVKKLIENNKGFDKRFIRSNHEFYFDKRDIARWVDNMKKGKKDTELALRMLYSNLDYKNKNFDIDHMHPHVMFTKKSNYNKSKINKYDDWNIKCNCIANLQVLKEYENRNKQGLPLKEWIKQMKKDYNLDYDGKNNYINKKIRDHLDFKDFNIFYNERKKLIVSKLYKVLHC